MNVLVDGQPHDSVPVHDRGLRYGDGLFETVRISGGQAVWWEAHLQRLQRGCAVLGLAMPERAVLENELAVLCARSGDGVLRVVLTRGDGGRGYGTRGGATTRRILELSPPPRRLPAALAVDWCALRLSVQPRLAGLKHLNRLEQVLAARECAAAGLDECLLMDTEGAPTCGISTNLFVVRAGRLETPLLDRCGIAGTCRSWLLATHPELRVARFDRATVEQADELFLCNSVRGILPVQRMATRELPIGPVTRALMGRLAREVPALGAQRD